MLGLVAALIAFWPAIEWDCGLAGLMVCMHCRVSTYVQVMHSVKIISPYIMLLWSTVLPHQSFGTAIDVPGGRC
jgi:hypothetical protein